MARRPIAVIAGFLALLGVLAVARAEAEPRLPARGGDAAATSALGDGIRLNQIQVVGSHNSYKRMISSAEQSLRQTFIGADNAKKMAYQHEPLGQQFQHQKVRQIELDLFVDNSGGKYSSPLIRNLAAQGAYNQPAMDQPGIKVMHVQDVDYASTCLTFKQCLSAVEQWSDANPQHVPIAILVELKDDTPVPVITQSPEPWNAAAMAAMDAEIRSVFSPSDLITPDDVRGSRATLNQAVLQDGWPTLGESRGKVMFLMDNEGGYRSTYLQGNPNLQGRPVFTAGQPGQPDGAFIKRNDPNASDIQSLVQAGYVVRTRSDADTQEARTNNIGPRDIAFASGAQWVSTDYPAPNMGYGFSTNFSVQVPGGTVARCNPVNAPPGCQSTHLDGFDLVNVPTTTTTTSTTTSTTTTTTQPTTTTSSTTTTSTTSTTTTQPTTTTTQPACSPDLVPFASAPAAVTQLYRDLTGAPPSSIELSSAAGSVAACESTLDELAVGLLPASQKTDDARLVRLYEAFFQRPPDPSGFAYWQRQLDAGRGLINAALKFAQSNEFKTTYGPLSNGAFVDLVYQNVLERPADAAGKAYWVNRLNNGVSNRGAVMINFSESNENVNAKAWTVAAWRLFRGMRQAFPSNGELDALIEPLTVGAPLTSVARSIRLSPAYAARF